VKKRLILMTILIISALMIVPAMAQTQTQTTPTGTAPAQDKAPATLKAVAAPEKTPVAKEQQSADEQKEILQKIQNLEKQVDTLKEQGRTRDKLTITAEEKSEQEKSVLTAAGREYTLMQKGKYELEYSLRYEYISSNEIIAATRVEPRSNHTIRNGIGIQYGLFNNLTVNMNIPYVYVYDKTNSAAAKSASDMGDMTMGIDFQPFKSGGDWPSTTISMSAILPTGRSPYKINRNTDLPTGGGLYGFSLGVNMSKSIDPAMAFGGLSCTYRLSRDDLDQNMDGAILDEVEPGISVNAAIGMAYSISYAVSMNVQFQYGYNMGTDYTFTNAPVVRSSAYSTASLLVGTGWRISPTTTLSFGLGIGLTKDDPDFTVSFRLPFSL
jgi:hypothetical protein